MQEVYFWLLFIFLQIILSSPQRLLLGLRCSIQTSTAMEAFALISLRNSGVQLLQFRRSCSPSAHCLRTQILMILLYPRSPTCISQTGQNMKPLHAAGLRSMPWDDSFRILQKWTHILWTMFGLLCFFFFFPVVVEGLGVCLVVFDTKELYIRFCGKSLRQRCFYVYVSSFLLEAPFMLLSLN